MPTGVYKKKPGVIYGGYKLGHKHSVELIKKMSETHKKLGTIPPNQKGYKHSEETKEGISKSTKGVKKSMKMRENLSASKRGDKNYRWKDGVTPLRKRIYKSYKTKIWRESIFERDKYACQWCGEKGRLEAHHTPIEFAVLVDNLKVKTLETALADESFWNINNGITLCYECHKTTKKGSSNLEL